jgi:sporulation protein YlmC with PRC-barrel domain
MLKKLALAVAIASSAVAFAQAQTPTKMDSPRGDAKTLSTLPTSASTVTDWYKQNVYDGNNNKIGSVSDVLVDRAGKIEALMVSVGGFLGVDEKTVAVPFDAVRLNKNADGKTVLNMDATKQALESAPGYKYDHNKSAWVPA